MATSAQLIRDIVSNQSSAASVLERFEIDLCLYGNDSLQHVCTELQLSLDQVLEKLSDAETTEDGAGCPGLSSYSLYRLIQHVVRVHHSYLRRELPRLSSMAHKLAEVRGHQSPELLRIDDVLSSLHTVIVNHLEKEEQLLFPYLASMEQGPEKVAATGQAHFSSITQPIRRMLREHELAKGLLEELRNLTAGFTAPDLACVTHRALFAGLRQFETSLAQHLHVEDDILFPRAISLEGAVAEGSRS